LKPIASGLGAPLAHVALQWLLSRPAVGSVIAGAKRPSQVDDNAAADAVILDDATRALLDEALG
jgi:aryl-alcohol dehydrogenase-like predicted oxidoreductase